MKTQDASITHIETASFPLLSQIPCPPSHLFIRGTMPEEKEVFFLTVVGSRKHSAYGESATRHLIEGLAGYPVVIVSGLALGIDSIAHQSALAVGLQTIAIPGSGLSENVLYPSSHRGLAQNIIAQGGALLSEYEPDFHATHWSFPKRNRIMAGISHATLIIEASEQSGSLITARLALDYNRDIGVVPGQITSSFATGSNKLLREGATPVTSSKDIRELLGIEETVADQICTRVPLPEKQSTIVGAIIKQLDNEPCDQDALANTLSLSAPEIQRIITEMELSGIIRRQGGMIHLVPH